MLELSRPLTLTWLEEDEVVGVSAPLDIWVGQLVLALPVDIRGKVMDRVIAEVNRLNALEEEELEELGLELPEEEEDEGVPVVVHQRTFSGVKAGNYQLRAFIRDRSSKLYGGATPRGATAADP